jgi:hypothetical protein
MATRKTESPPPQLQLSDAFAWLACFAVNKAHYLAEHDGKKLPGPGASHLAAEATEKDMVEFKRRFPS